jgi:hypothetical protein
MLDGHAKNLQPPSAAVESAGGSMLEGHAKKILEGSAAVGSAGGSMLEGHAKNLQPPSAAVESAGGSMLEGHAKKIQLPSTAMESATESMLEPHANNIQLQTISRSPQYLNNAHLVKVPAIRPQGITRLASAIQRPHAPAHTYAAVVGNSTATRGKTHDLKAPTEQHRAGKGVLCLYT